MTSDLHSVRADKHPPFQRVVCAWCEKLIRRGVEPVSHGICPDCSDAELALLPLSFDGAVTYIEAKVWPALTEVRSELADALVLTDTDRLVAVLRKLSSVGELARLTALRLEGRHE